MDSSDLWAKCAKCGAELKQGDKQCPRCASTAMAYERPALVKEGIIVHSKTKQKRKPFKNPIRQMISRRKASGDPRLKDGVQEEITIDQEKDEYHQVVKDAKTGQILHEHHEPLSKHK